MKALSCSATSDDQLMTVSGTRKRPESREKGFDILLQVVEKEEELKIPDLRYCPRRQEGRSALGGCQPGVTGGPSREGPGKKKPTGGKKGASYPLGVFSCNTSLSYEFIGKRRGRDQNEEQGVRDLGGNRCIFERNDPLDRQRHFTRGNCSSRRKRLVWREDSPAVGTKEESAEAVVGESLPAFGKNKEDVLAAREI